MPLDPAQALDPSYEITRLKLDVDIAASLALLDLVRGESEVPLHEDPDAIHDLDVHRSDRDDETSSGTGTAVRHVESEELRKLRVHLGRDADPGRVRVLGAEGWQGPIESKMPSFHDDKPVAPPEVLRFPPHDLALLVDDGKCVIVRRANPETELRLDGEDLRGPVVLRHERVRKAGSVEDPIASEVLAEGWAVQELAQRLESLRRPEEAVDRDTSSLLDRLSGRVEDLHERDRAGGNAHGRLHKVAFRSQPGEGKTGSPASLVDQSLLFQG